MNCMLTIANKSNSADFIAFCYKNGMRDFRVNMAYENDAMNAIANLEKINKDISIFIDFPGIKQRIQLPPQTSELELRKNMDLTVWTYPKDFPYITNMDSIRDKIREEQILSFADGRIVSTVSKIYNDKISIRFKKIECALRNNAGCSFLGNKDTAPSLSLQYCNSLLLHPVLQEMNGFKQKWGVLSFVDNPDSIRTFVDTMHSRSILVMAKVETPNGVENLIEISRCVDGILIGRGDLKNLAGQQYKDYYKRVLSLFPAIPSKVQKGVGTFFLQNYAMTKKVLEDELAEIEELKKALSNFFMLSKEVVNSNYPYETVLLAKKITEESKK